MFEGICEALHHELDQLDEKYSKGNGQMNMQDLETINKATHALKSLATYEAMKGSSEYGGSYYGGSNGGSYEGGSNARGRSRTTGRYISRDSRDYDPYRDPDGYRK